jgi:glycosyltransferase involved in cell wall biosynthesis
MMNVKKGKYVFVVPTASINGAIILLMHFFDYLLKHYPDIKIETIVQWGRDKDSDAFFRTRLSEYGNVTFLQELSEDKKSSLKKRIETEEIQAIFFNSILSIETQLFFAAAKCKKIFYVHEMEKLMNVFNLKTHEEYYNRKNNHFVAGSSSVKDALMRVLKLADERIDVVHSFINPEHIREQARKFAEAESVAGKEVKKKFTIGFSGTFELRKSADLLLPLVREIKKKIKDPSIFWVGAQPFNGEPETYEMVMQDVKLGGFENDIIFLPKSLDYIKHHRKFDVYVILSREDPFPLVNIEMGAMGVPIICFDRSGGSPDYANMGGGIAVPFMDLEAIADKLYEFYSNPKLLEEYKKNIPEIVNNNFSIQSQAPKLFNIMQNFIK